jgi:hypothetical protein
VEHIFLPSRHRVGTVGAASLMQQPLCDFRVEPMMVFRTTDTSATAKRVGTCVSRLREVKPENATDIRGALHFASRSLRGDRSMTRGIVLITDLEEFIPKNRVAAEPDLRGICVNVYTVMTPASAARPDSLALREKDWNARIMKWGAKRVRVQSVLGFDAEDLAGFFRSCAS